MKKFTLLLFIFAINILQAQVPQSERDALIALYNATNGPNWTNNTNWNTTNPVSSWYGITVSNINGQDHVTEIILRYKNLNGVLPVEIGDFPQLVSLNLKGNNLSGNIPLEIGNLTNLSYLNLGRNDLSGTIPTSLSNLTTLSYVYLYSNHFSGLFPDFTSNTNLKYLSIIYNDFQFADLEPNFNAINTLTQSNNGRFYYTVMNPIDTELSIDMVTGNNYTFNMPTVSGTGVTYQWYFNDSAIPGATGQTYTINNAQNSNLGDYVCKASSPIIPDLTIDRNIIHLYGTVIQSDKDALLALYNATDGPNWTNHDNWDTTEKVYNWYGIKMRGNRVTEIDLQNNNLNGTIPSNIGDLTALINLNLSYNGSFYPGDLHGSIPPEIGNLSSLEYLWIDFANLSGNIPSEIGNLSNLKDLALWYNQLTGSIPPEIGNLSNLETLTVENNPLTGTIPANLANLTKMRYFWIGNNQLTGDIPTGLFDNMPDLIYAAIYGNDVTGDIDLSHNPELRGVWMNDLLISSIDMRNGHNDKINYFTTSYDQNTDIQNPNLTCIYVDDKNASYLSSWDIGSNTHFVETQAECDALVNQTTYVPDDNFENYLETHDAQGNPVPVGDTSSMGNGIANDDYVFTSRISNVTSLNVRNKNIYDLTGIEDFTNLQILDASRNNLNAINLSQNNQLLILDLGHNQFSNINISTNSQLTNLDLCFNQLTNIDVNQNINLTHLSLCVNQLNSVNLFNNINLEYLDLGANNISDVDLSHNTHLKWLYLYTLNLTNLTLNQLPQLRLLHVKENHLSHLDLSQNSNIETLFLYDNELVDLDVSQNPNLKLLWVYNNNLSHLNVQNGHNSLLTGTNFGNEKFRATGNPNLTCIFVDDATYCSNNWTQIDPTSHFVETQAECDALSIDESFKTSIQVYPNPFTDKIEIKVEDAANIKTISIQNMQGQIVYKGDYTAQINLENLPAGMYLLNIEDQQGNQAVFKLMKN